MATESKPALFPFLRPDWRHWLARLEHWPAWKLFLGALLLGLLLSLPWQCARQFGASKNPVTTPAEGAEATVVAATPAAQRGSAASILGMPKPAVAPIIEASTEVPPAIDGTATEPLPGGVTDSSANQAAGEAVAAIAVFSPAPDYPASALRSRDEGTVLVRVTIDQHGMPLDISIERSSRSRALDRAALDALRQWRFKPAMAQGAAVESSLVIPISFKANADR